MSNTSELSPAAKAAASELNNLLHIIAGTADIIGNVWQGSEMADKYVAMLRDSVERAAAITTELITAVGDNKIVFHPAAVEAARQPRRNRGPRVLPPPRRHILVVDDEPMALALAQQVLEDAGYDVTLATSGFECLKLFADAPERFALIILDLAMPMMDGEETFERLRAMKSDVRVLLNPGFIDRARVDALCARGLAAVLMKPAAPDEYVAKIGTILADPAGNPAHGTPAA